VKLIFGEEPRSQQKTRLMTISTAVKALVFTIPARMPVASRTTGTVSPNGPGEVATKAGAGPRHLTFRPNGRFAYLITETTATIGTYAVDSALASSALNDAALSESAISLCERPSHPP
jgi:hypothetical protein